MDIKKLFDGLEFEWLTAKKCDDVVSVTHIADNIKNGDCYVSLYSNDYGMENITKAASNGAKIVVVDKYITAPENVAVIKTCDIRYAYAIMAKNYYMKCVDKMKMIAVVGTNGKSTTSYLIWSVLTKNNIMCGFIGTGYYMIGNKRFKSEMTTPDPMKLHQILSIMANSGVKIVVMEVSSHAIYYQKIAGIKYKIAVFTNLSQDHLDFFVTMENLEQVKHSFFLNGLSEISVINVDDESGRRLADKLSLPNVTFALDRLADIYSYDLEYLENGIKFKMSILRKNIIESKLVGKFNAYNLTACVIVCKLCNLRISNIISAIKTIEPLDGRANIMLDNGVRYVIDYAHTPDGIKNILTDFKAFTKGKIIIVFGAGGNRDCDKRHKMGEIAANFADIVIITSDNPRWEEPKKIMYDIYHGMTPKTENVFLIEDRKLAIEKAISLAENGDTIIVAGKGGEEYMEKKGQKYPYNDKLTIEEILGRKWR